MALGVTIHPSLCRGVIACSTRDCNWEAATGEIFGVIWPGNVFTHVFTILDFSFNGWHFRIAILLHARLATMKTTKFNL